MSRKRLFIAVVALGVLAAGLFEPLCTLCSYVTGEPFYRGKPASYWSRELQRWVPVAWVQEGGRTEKRAIKWGKRVPEWKVRIYRWSPTLGQKLIEEQQPILDGDPAARAVLQKLLADENPDVRQMAAFGLARLNVKASR